MQTDEEANEHKHDESITHLQTTSLGSFDVFTCTRIIFGRPIVHNSLGGSSSGVEFLLFSTFLSCFQLLNLLLNAFPALNFKFPENEKEGTIISAW